MNSKLLYFVGGVVAGSAATSFVLYRRMNKRIEEEVESVKKAYSEREPIGRIIKKEESDSGVSFTVEMSPKDISQKNTKMKEDLMKSVNISDANGYSSMAVGVEYDGSITYRDPNQKTAYNLFSNPPKAVDIHNGIDEGEDLNVELVSDYEDVVDSTPPSEGLADEPYTISPEDFVNDKPFFDKITLEYFTDDVLSNAISEEIVTDISGTIGRESLNKFGEYEEDVVYVRNEKLSTDYEVILQHRPFAILPEGDD